MSIDFIKYTKDINGKFGFEEINNFPCTLGADKKAGMNAVELGKSVYMQLFYYSRMLKILRKKGEVFLFIALFVVLHIIIFLSYNLISLG